jgi:hypothetical protein
VQELVSGCVGAGARDDTMSHVSLLLYVTYAQFSPDDPQYLPEPVFVPLHSSGIQLPSGSPTPSPNLPDTSAHEESGVARVPLPIPSASPTVSLATVGDSMVMPLDPTTVAALESVGSFCDMAICGTHIEYCSKAVVDCCYCDCPPNFARKCDDGTCGCEAIGTDEPVASDAALIFGVPIMPFLVFLGTLIMFIVNVLCFLRQQQARQLSQASGSLPELSPSTHFESQKRGEGAQLSPVDRPSRPLNWMSADKSPRSPPAESAESVAARFAASFGSSFSSTPPNSNKKLLGTPGSASPHTPNRGIQQTWVVPSSLGPVTPPSALAAPKSSQKKLRFAAREVEEKRVEERR